MDCFLVVVFLVFTVQLLSVKNNKFLVVILFLTVCLLTMYCSSYQDDYYVTSDQMYVPLRWIAPELVDEVHGNLLVADQTQQSNMW